MRLTLRTLLAYLDDILEPADAESIGKKVEDSEFATGLVTRIRDTTRRLRLGAPKLTGRGPGLDPNTVAEYLDNTLSTERVPDFEKVCLEADVQLAEVASCHQILTLVLGEPAEVDPKSRQRMYNLALRPKSADELTPHGETPARRPKPEVPGYLRDDRRRLSRVVAVAAAIALFALFTWVAFRSIRPAGEELASSAAGQPEGSAPEMSGDPQGTPARSQPEDRPSTNEGSQPPDTPADTPLDMPVPQTDSAPEADDTSPAPLDAPPQPAEVSPESRLTHEPDSTASDNSDAHQPADSDSGDSAATSAASAPASPDTTVPPAQLGQFITPSELLIKYDAATSDWRRLPPNEIVYPGETLLALPSFRPRVTLGIGVGLLQLFGGTKAALDETGEDGVPGVTVAYGRTVMMTAGRAGAQIRLHAGNRGGLLTFEDPESTVAVEVRPYRVEGSDPETVPPRLAVDLYIARGRVQWQDAAGGEAETLQAPAARQLQAPTQGAATEDTAGDGTPVLPPWTLGSTALSLAERQAANYLRDQIPEDRSVRLSLQELTPNRRNEIWALATRALTHLNDFEPIIEALDDLRQRAYWNDHVESLRAALARGPEVAAQLRSALSRRYPSGGEELYRMLWGYTETQLRDGEDARLVEYLNHKDLAFNILAIWNLRGITDKSLLYHPQDKPADRQRSLRRWRQELDEGLIVPGASGDE